MLYNLRIGKSRFTGKTIMECCNIIASREDKINAGCRTDASVILFEIRTMDKSYIRHAFYGTDGKIFVSINRRGSK